MRHHHAVLVALVAAVTLTSVAAAGPDAPKKQRVAITWKGVVVPSPPAVDRFVLVPLGAGPLESDSGTESGVWSNRDVTRDGQSIMIETGVTKGKGKRGTYEVRYRTEWVDAGDGYHAGVGTLKFVRGTGQYAGITGVLRTGQMYRDPRFFGRAEGFLTVP